MHILLIHQIFNTPNEGGGTRHYELAKFLVKMGHKVTVIASDVDYLTGNKKGKKSETKDGIEVIYSATYQAVHKNFLCRAISFLFFSLTSFIDAIRVKDIDIIWGTSPPLFQALTSFIISKLKRKPFVFEVRDLWLDFSEELGIIKNHVIIKILKLLEKILYKFSHKIIVNSPGFIPFIRKYVSEDKINLIPNGIISNYFEIKNSNLLNFRYKLGLNNKFIAIYLGNIGFANDIETIFNAAYQLRKYRKILFVIMGGGIKKVRFKKYILKNRISNVLMLDSQPKSEIPKILAEVDVCLATLKNISLFKTTYPNKVFDYMAAKKPTILAIDGVIREVIELSNGGSYINPGDNQAMAETILKYYNNPELKERHGENARNYVKQHFERENITKNLEKILLPLARQ